MIKNKISFLLCLMIVFSCFAGMGTVNAVDAQKEKATISYDSMKSFIGKLVTDAEGKDSAQIEDAIKLLVYLNDDGIGNLIKTVEDPNFIPGEQLKPFRNLVIKYKDSYKNEMLFSLCFIKSIIESDRMAAITNFTKKVPYTNLSKNQEDALADIYSIFVTNTEFKLRLEQENSIADNVLLSLFSCVKSYFVLTDSEADKSKLALKKINNSTFATRLTDNMTAHFESINGKTPDSANVILNVILDSVNKQEKDSSIIAKYKQVFDALGMYVEYKAPVSDKGEGTKTPTGVPNPTYTKPIAVPPPPPVPAAPSVPLPSDAKQHWASRHINALASKGIVKGNENGECKPDEKITREDTAVILVRALGLDSKAPGTNVSFNDNDSIADYAKNAVALCIELGIFKGYDDGNFKPKGNITREELATVIGRALKKNANSTTINFNDKGELGDWSAEFIRKAYALGIISGYEDNTFRPQNDITRAETFVMIYNFAVTEGLLKAN